MSLILTVGPCMPLTFLLLSKCVKREKLFIYWRSEACEYLDFAVQFKSSSGFVF